MSVLSGRALFEYKKDLFKDADEGEGDVVVGVDSAGVGADVAAKGEGLKDKVINDVAEQVQSDLFLDGEDDDLDDLDDLDDE